MLLCAALIISAAAGCRDSSAFTQIVYNQQSEDEVDDDEMIDNDKENTEYPDDEIYSVTESTDTDKTRDYDRTVAQYSSDGTSDNTTRDVTYSASASDFYTSSQTRNPDESGLEEGLDTTDGDSQSEGDESDDANGETSSSSEIDDIDIDFSAGSTSDSADSSTIDSTTSVNEDIATGTGAAALGAAAVLVQMLGGEGALMATDDSFKTATVGSISASYVFADELPDELIYLGDIESFSEISTSAFNSLYQAASDGYVDIIFMTSGDSFTSTQKSKLLGLGVSIQYLEDMSIGMTGTSTSTNALLYNIEIIAAALGDRTENGGQNASTLASAYETWYTSALSNLNTSSGDYTCYISSYDSDVVATFSYNGVSYSTNNSVDTGLPIVKACSTLAFSYYLSRAGVTATNSVTDCGAGSSISLHYLHTIIGNTVSKSCINGLSGVNFRTSKGTDYNSKTGTLAFTISPSGTCLGSSTFPIILTACKSIKSKIETSRDNGGVFSTTLSQSYFGYSTGDSSVAVSSTDYNVYVVPYGVCSWVEGSAESCLLSYWAAYKFYGTYDEASVIANMQVFYETFYRWTATDSECSTILAGDQG